jgi:hypothetical protein
MRFKPSPFYVLPSVAALLLVALHWAQPPTIVAQIDLPPAYDPANVLHKCAFVWSGYRSYYGSVDACFSWLPYRAAELALYSLFGASVGQALLFGCPLVASWLGAFACARALGVSAPAAFLTAWLYAFNPARQSMFGLFATGDACAALLPWFVYWIVVAAREPSRRPRATWAIALLALSLLVVLAVTPQLLAALVLCCVVIAIWLWLQAADRVSYARWGGTTALVAIAASAWWLVPNALGYLGAPVAHPVAPESIAWTFDRASLLNEMRFAPLWFWRYAEYNPWAIEFERNAWFYVSGLVPALCAAAALALCRGDRLRQVRFFAGFALVMLFVAKGLHAPLPQANVALYRLPGMVLFIEPYGPILIAALALAICGGIGSEAMLRAGVAAARIEGASIGVAVALLWWNNLATVTGAIFHEMTEATPGVHIALPDDWRDAARFLNASAAVGGVAVFPPDDFYQADYDWGYHGVDTLADELIHRDVLMPGAPWGYTLLPEAATLNAEIVRLVERRSRDAARLLADLGVRYALVRFDALPVNHGYLPTRAEYAAVFGSPAATFGALEIFDLGPAAAQVRRVRGLGAEDFDDGSEADERPEVRTSVWTEAGRRSRTFAIAGPIPSVIGQSPVDSTSMRFDVFNPGLVATRASIDISVWPRGPATYRLGSDTGYATTRAVTAPSVPQAVDFAGVPLRSGDTMLLFGEPRTFANSMAAFLPPRIPPATQAGSHVDTITIVDFIPTRPATATTPVLIRVGATLDREPSVTVEGSAAAASVPTGWRIEAREGARRFTCFDEYWTGQTYEIGDSIRRCRAGGVRPLTDDDAARIRVDSLSLATDAPFGSDDIGMVTTSVWEERPSSGTPVIERAPEPETMPIRDRVSGLGAVVSLNGGHPWPLVLAQAYSSTWIALDVTHAKILPHERAFGWANAWESPASGTIVLVNWLSALSLLLGATGIALVVWLWRR